MSTWTQYPNLALQSLPHYKITQYKRDNKDNWFTLQGYLIVALNVWHINYRVLVKCDIILHPEEITLKKEY